MWCEGKILPALSVSNDVAIKPSHYSCWPHQWAPRELRMKTDGLPTANPSSVQRLPTVYPEGIQGGEKQVILAPDSWGAYQRNGFSEPRLAFFHTQKSAKFLNWGIWFSIINSNLLRFLGFLGGSDGSVCLQFERPRFPGLGRSPGEGNANLLQYSCLENPMNGGAW